MFAITQTYLFTFQTRFAWGTLKKKCAGIYNVNFVCYYKVCLRVPTIRKNKNMNIKLNFKIFEDKITKMIAFRTNFTNNFTRYIDAKLVLFVYKLVAVRSILHVNAEIYVLSTTAATNNL